MCCADVASSSASSSGPLRPVCIEFMCVLQCTCILFHCDLLVFVEPRDRIKYNMYRRYRYGNTNVYLAIKSSENSNSSNISIVKEHGVFVCVYARARLSVCVCATVFNVSTEKKNKQRQDNHVLFAGLNYSKYARSLHAG